MGFYGRLVVSMMSSLCHASHIQLDSPHVISLFGITDTVNETRLFEVACDHINNFLIVT